jgi:hypothetical protein
MIVNLYLGEEMPYKAATLLERELDRGRIERNRAATWNCCPRPGTSAPRPRTAIEPLAEAAELSESGELYLRLARLHMDAYQLAEATPRPARP